MKAHEIKKLLSDLKVTEADLDNYWKFCQVFSHSLARNYTDWRELNYSAAKNLPKTYKRLTRRMIYGNNQS